MSCKAGARSLAASCCVLLLAACAQRAAPPLYMWDSFPKHQYAALQNRGASPVEQIGALETQAEKARAMGASLPPGFRAHMGMLKLSIGDVDRAKELWLAEKVAFPESAPYMNQLLKRLDKPVEAAKVEKPA